MAIESKRKLGVCAAQTGHGRSCLTMLMLTVALACCSQASRAGVVLFDNLSGANAGSTGVTNTQWTAQAFSTTATDFVLDEVSLRLWDVRDTTEGNFEIQVWDAAGDSGSPGAQVGSAIYTGLAENLADSSSLLTISVKEARQNKSLKLALVRAAISFIVAACQMGSLFTGFKQSSRILSMTWTSERGGVGLPPRRVRLGAAESLPSPRRQVSAIERFAKEFANSSLTNLWSLVGNAARVAGENEEPRSTPAWRRRWIGSLTR